MARDVDGRYTPEHMVIWDGKLVRSSVVGDGAAYMAFTGFGG